MNGCNPHTHALCSSLRKAIVFSILLCTVFAATNEVFADDEVFVPGRMLTIDMKEGNFFEDNKDKTTEAASRALFEIEIENAYPKEFPNDEGEVLPAFTSEQIISDGTMNSFSIIFDGISCGIYNNMTLPTQFDFVDSLTFKDRVGLYSDPDQILTPEGNDIRSMEITFKSRKGIFYQFKEINRGDKPGKLLIRFYMQSYDTPEQNTYEPVINITMDDIDLPVANVANVRKTVLGDNAEKAAAQVAGEGTAASSGPAFAEDLLAAGVAKNSASAEDEQMQKIKTYLSNLQSDAFSTVYYKLKHISPANANTLIKEKLSLLGTITQDTDNQALLITDRSDYTLSLVETLELIDIPAPQVVIQVKILEVSWKENERIGFNWGLQNLSNKYDNAGNFLDGNFYEGTLKSTLSNAASSANSSSIVFGTLGSESSRLVELQLEALNEKGKVSLLAEPKVRVKNNSEATFHAGATIPYYYVSSYSVSKSDTKTDTASDNLPDATASNTSAALTKTTYDIGVELTVQPRITNSGLIELELTPEVSELGGWEGPNNIPIILSRTLTTTVTAKDGDTLLIAGLFKNNEVSKESSIPGLNKIPLLKKLFRTRGRENNKVETVFMLKINLVK